MPFIYVDELGFKRVISHTSLKKKLITLSRESEYSSILETNQLKWFVGLNSSNTDISVFFDKLDLTLPIVYYNDIERLLSKIINTNEEGSELIKTLFSMERIHFLTIIYLLYENKIILADIKDIISMPYYNRSEYILGFLEREEMQVSINSRIIKSFSKFIKSFPSRELLETSISSPIKYPSTTITINNKQFSYFHNSIGLTGSRNFSINPFSQVDNSMKIPSYQLFNGTLASTKSEYNKLEALTSTKYSHRIVDFINYIFNVEFPKILRLTIVNRTPELSLQSEEFRIISKELESDIVKRGIGYSINTSKPPTLPLTYFDFLNWAYADTDNYFSTGNTVPNAANQANFNYINENFLKDFLNKLFPDITVSNSTVLDKTSPAYMNRYFINLYRHLPGNESITQAFFHSTLKYGGLARNSLKINPVVDHDDKLISLGYANGFIANYENLLLEIMEEFLEEVDLESDGLDWEDIEEYLDECINSVIPSFKEYEYTGEESNAKNIQKYFYADLFENYIKYLKDPGKSKTDDPSKELSASSMKVYRAITFVQQTFVNIEKFNTSVNSTRELDLFYLFFFFFNSQIDFNSRMEKTRSYTVDNNRNLEMIRGMKL